MHNPASESPVKTRGEYGMPSSVNRKRTRKFAHNLVAVVAALSLVMLQTPMSYAAPDPADEELPVAAQETSGSNGDEDALELTAEEDADAVDETDTGDQADDVDADAQEEAQAEDQTQTDEEADAAEDEAQEEEAGAESTQAAEEDLTIVAAEAEEEADDEDAAAEDEIELVAAATTESTSSSSEEESTSSSSDSDSASATYGDTEFTYESTTKGKAFKVTATPDENAEIPEDAKLVVTQVTSSTKKAYNYEAYMKALNNEGAKSNITYSSDNTLLYDVAFIVTGEDGKTKTEVQPADGGTVKLKFEFESHQLTTIEQAEDAGDLHVIHLPLKDPSEYPTTAKATDITADDITIEKVGSSDMKVVEEDTGIELTAKEFSIYAISTAAAKDDPSTTGNLSVTKTVTGGPTQELVNQTLAFAVTTTVNGTTQYLDAGGTLHSESTTIPASSVAATTADDGSITYTLSFSGIPTGTYAVTESGQTLSGYTLNSDSATSGTATVEADETAQVGLVNNYTAIPAKASITVNKYATGTTTRVTGATLSIIDKDTSSTVKTWATTSAAYSVSDLDVGKSYILREMRTPTGYTKATDVEFKITDASTVAIEIASGAKTSGGAVNASASNGVLNIYDAKSASSSTSSRAAAGSTSPRTGDETPVVAVSIVAAIALIAALAAYFRRRAQRYL